MISAANTFRGGADRAVLLLPRRSHVASRGDSFALSCRVFNILFGGKATLTLCHLQASAFSNCTADSKFASLQFQVSAVQPEGKAVGGGVEPGAGRRAGDPDAGATAVRERSHAADGAHVS